MPKWWPWGRSKHPDTEPAAPAVRPEPAWHRLPAVQRTVGDIEPTAQLRGFTASLTTSQNPGFTGPLELLAAEHSDRLPVLDVVRDFAGTAAHPVTAPAAPTHQSRTWAPKIPIAQRAHLGSGPAIQRTADVAVTLPEVYPVEAAGPAEAAPRFMVEAPQPDDRRMLEVATEHELAADEPQSVSSVAPQPASGHEPGTIDNPPSRTDKPVSPAAHHAPPTPPVVQRMPSVADPIPAAPQAVSTTSPGSTGTTLGPPPRHLPSVQRAVTGSDTAPERFTGTRPIPVLRTIDSPASQPPPRKSDTVTTKPAGDSGTTVQRSTDPGPVRANTTDATTPSPTATVPPSTPASGSDLPVMRSVEAHPPITPPPPVTAQRITANTEERKPAPPTGRSPAPDVVAPSLPAIEVQRLPVVEAHPAAKVAGPEPERQAPALPSMQLSPSVVSARPLTGRSTATVPEVHVHADEAPGGSDSRSEAAWESTPQTGIEATRELHPVPHTTAPEHAAPSAPQSGVVQRVALPVVEPTSIPNRAGSPATPSRSESTVSPVVQRAATGRRLVVLPPVRSSSSRTQQPRDDSPIEPARSLLFDSPRPVGLQRMFEPTNAKRTDSATGFRPAGSGSAGFTSASSSGDSSSSDSDSGVPQFETSGPSYDPSTNTITFASPTVQREPEAAPPAPEPAPAAASAPTMTLAPAAPGPAPGGDVDELVNRLYDPLAARLRAELWLDRERAGVLMDLGR